MPSNPDLDSETVTGVMSTTAPTSPVRRAVGSILSDSALRRAASCAVATTVAGAVLGLVFVVVIPFTGSGDLSGRLATGAFVVGMTGLTLAGGMLVRRQPRFTMGWLLVLTGLAGVLARASVGFALVADAGGLSGADVAGWITNWSWVPAQGLALVLLLRFPNGRLPGPRWRPVEWSVVGWSVMVAVVTAFLPGPLGVQALASRSNPIGVAVLAGPMDRVLDVLFVVLPGLVVLSVAAPVVRWRQASGEERQQLRWIAAAAVLVAVTAPLAVASDAGAVLEGIAFLVLPAAIVAAVLRHQLWDVELRRSYNRLRAAREEERSRLQRELHDSLGPILGSVSMRAEAARNLLTAGAQPLEIDKLLADIGTETESALVEVRRLIDELRPSALVEVDLVTAIREHLASYVTGPVLTLDVSGTLPAVKPNVEVVAYRVVCEAVRNAVRHSDARSCRVRLAPVAGDLRVEVVDDGAGLRGQPSGVGRQTMARRVSEIDGTLSVSEIPKGGVRVVAVLGGGGE